MCTKSNFQDTLTDSMPACTHPILAGNIITQSKTDKGLRSEISEKRLHREEPKRNTLNNLREFRIREKKEQNFIELR